ncbi:MAG: ParB N-terminal domain-containing protein, partial [Gammaproteobacteria bacterium]|nr:ParB N-terminal domain-containing protein [Gammaproteobacteria bacterium]
MTQTHTNTTTSGDVITIAQNLLIRGRDNVRTVKSEKVADQQLIASIRQVGVLQNIIVKPSKTQPGFFEVDAGGRRWAAVAFLVKKGELPDDFPIPAKIHTEGSSAAVSLAENLHAPMHPADEFVAFAAMRKDGMTEADIAEHFGLSVQRVAKRMKLAEVHPKILNAYRKEAITLDTVMAFTLAASKSQQLAVFKELGEQCHGHRVRRRLTNDGARSDGALAIFVGVDAYKAAGGVVVADLFEERAYLPDVELLQQLVSDKLAQSAERLQKEEGWKTVDVVTDRNRCVHNYHRLEPEPVDVPTDLTDALCAAVDAQSEME